MVDISSDELQRLRRIAGEDPEFEAELEREIEEQSKVPTFIPSLWREHRRKGMEPDEIDYDMCHVFR